ncbi:MAG TPA: hypothetical protein VGE52_19170, partial [Pirellulales bacterium]
RRRHPAAFFGPSRRDFASALPVREPSHYGGVRMQASPASSPSSRPTIGRRAFLGALACFGASSVVPGCTPFHNSARHAEHPNPVVIPIRDADVFWEHLVRVIGDYFRIAREERVKLVGDTLTEGYLETAPQVGATALEPWRRDSVGVYERAESTLQSIRRRAVIRVQPIPEGYLVHVEVYKELEDLPRPEQAAAGDATFRFENSVPRYTEPVGIGPPTLGWIPQGRDVALEQHILGRLLSVSH